jgi:cytochrome b561
VTPARFGFFLLAVLLFRIFAAKGIGKISNSLDEEVLSRFKAVGGYLLVTALMASTFIDGYLNYIPRVNLLSLDLENLEAAITVAKITSLIILIVDLVQIPSAKKLKLMKAPNTYALAWVSLLIIDLALTIVIFTIRR